MKIALYCPNKPLSSPNPSGDLIIARGLHESLNEMGHDCREIVSFRSRWFWKSPEGLTGGARTFLETLRRSFTFQPDLWLTYHTYYKSPDVIGPGISRMLCVPYVLFQPMYGTKWRKDRRTWVDFYLNRLALKSASLAVANNLDDLEALRRVIPRHLLAYIPPGIAVEQFRRDPAAGSALRAQLGIPESVPVLFTAARFRADVKFQSLVYLLKAISILGQTRSRFVLLIAGDGPMERRLRELADAWVPGKVIFAGRVPRGSMARYYSAADLFVFPGIGESLGMVYLEAQACGLPVVALRTAGVPQVVRDGETGLLTAQDCGEAMAGAIAQLLEDSGWRQAMGLRASKFVREERNLLKNFVRLSQLLVGVRAAGQ